MHHGWRQCMVSLESERMEASSLEGKRCGDCQTLEELHDIGQM
jgi:hypothetical protein